MLTRRLLTTVLSAVLLSRLLLFGLVVLGSQLSFLGKTYSGTVWETRIELRSERLVPELVRVLVIGDAWWYQSIATHGYGARIEAAGVPNYAFFPLYPLAVRAFPITDDFALNGLILSNLMFAVAAVLLAAVAVQCGHTEDEAGRAVMYLAFFPTSYFFSMPLTESLFLALALASILAALHGRWAIAGIVGGAAALTRLPGILLLIPLALLFISAKARSRLEALWLLAVPAGTAAFMAYLNFLTGDPLAFVHVQQNWSRTVGGFWEPLIRYFMKPSVVSEPWNPILLNLGFALLLAACGIALLVRRQWAFGAYTLASLLLPLSGGSLQSLGRYSLVVFPLYLWLGSFGRDTAIDRLLFAASVTLYGWLIALLILRVDFAMA